MPRPVAANRFTRRRGYQAEAARAGEAGAYHAAALEQQLSDLITSHNIHGTRLTSIDSQLVTLRTDLANRYTKAESDARYYTRTAAQTWADGRYRRIGVSIPEADVDGLSAALDNRYTKSASDGRLTAGLAGKANTNHAHTGVSVTTFNTGSAQGHSHTYARVSSVH